MALPPRAHRIGDSMNARERTGRDAESDFALYCRSAGLHIYKNFDLVVLVMNQCFDTFLHNILQLDLPGDHVCRLDGAYSRIRSTMSGHAGNRGSNLPVPKFSTTALKSSFW